MHAKITVIPVRFNKTKYKIVKLTNFFEYDPHKIVIELHDMRELGRRGIECEIIMDPKYKD
tara:strand:- start:206 stop:388 length:183 start_codon:yes stop_codon:yes gene_type:complete